MATRTNEEKKILKQERVNKKEKLTNWYMINLTWGVVGILAMIFVASLYKNPAILVHMQTIAWVLTGLFAVSGIALYAFSGKFNNKQRAVNYSIFLGVCALFSLWLALYNVLRPLIQSVARVVLNNPNLQVYSYWNTRLPIIGICVYLVVSFIVYAVKVTKK